MQILILLLLELTLYTIKSSITDVFNFVNCNITVNDFVLQIFTTIKSKLIGLMMLVFSSRMISKCACNIYVEVSEIWGESMKSAN